MSGRGVTVETNRLNHPYTYARRSGMLQPEEPFRLPTNRLDGHTFRLRRDTVWMLSKARGLRRRHYRDYT